MARGIDPVKHERWRRLLRQWHSSDLNVRDFCARHKIHGSQFWCWKRRLGEESSARPVKTEPAFIPVTIVEHPAAAITSAAIDIRLTSGHRLRVQAGRERLLLGDVITLLEGRPC